MLRPIASSVTRVVSPPVRHKNRLLGWAVSQVRLRRVDGVTGSGRRGPPRYGIDGVWSERAGERAMPTFRRHHVTTCAAGSTLTRPPNHPHLWVRIMATVSEIYTFGMELELCLIPKRDQRTIDRLSRHGFEFPASSTAVESPKKLRQNRAAIRDALAKGAHDQAPCRSVIRKAIKSQVASKTKE